MSESEHMTAHSACGLKAALTRDDPSISTASDILLSRDEASINGAVYRARKYLAHVGAA